MDTANQQANRWQHYFARHGQAFNVFWREHLAQKRDVLLILGWGFDPRMCLGLEAILSLGGEGARDCLLIDFDEGEVSPSRKHDDIRKKNLESFHKLVSGRANIIEKKIVMVDENNRRVESRKAANLFGEISDIDKYTDIVLDISALPLGIYFPLLGKLLYLLDKPGASKRPNLHVIVAENAELDSMIKDQEVEEDAKYLRGFMSDLAVESAEVSQESAAEMPKVWIPLLGENQAVQLERIWILVRPDEICPVLPSPSVNPRRGDDLVIEYRELLSSMQVELRNIVYGSEQNPFEVYREIMRTVERYMKALKALGGCKVALSPLSSKLLSISAFLAAYEAKTKDISIGIAHVSAKGYIIDPIDNIDSINSKSELFELWIFGDCYAK